MQGRHALLSDAVEARERLLRSGDGLVVEPGDEIVRRLPGFGRGLTHDDMQPDAEGERAPARWGERFGPGDLGGDIRRWLAPGQVDVDMLGRHFVARGGRTAEIERRIGLLHWRIE